MSHKREREIALTAIKQPETPVKRAKLTRGNLERHTEDIMTKRKKSKTETASREEDTEETTSSTTDRKFQNALSRNNVRVFEVNTVKPPHDWEQIQAKINAPRLSPTPSTGDFEDYQSRFDRPQAELYVEHDLFDHFRQRYKRPFQSDYNVLWGELQEETGPVTYKLSPPRPDYADYRYSNYYPHHAEDALGGFLIPSARDYGLPHFVGEMKSTKEAVDRAFFQAAYDGAAIVHADQQAFEYAGTDFEFGQTRAISIQFNGKDLKINAHFAARDDQGDIEYRSYGLGVFHPSESFKQYKEARTAIRNAQDFGRDRSDEVFKMLSAVRRPPAPLLTPTSTAADAIAAALESADAIANALESAEPRVVE